MKTVYFVRHGQSEGNVGSVFQHADSPLTAKGIKQAEFIAERCTRLPIDVIISSTQPRAADTAQIISEKTKHEVELSDLFRERKKPSSLEDKPLDDAGAQKIISSLLRTVSFLDISLRALSLGNTCSQFNFSH